MNDQMFGNLAVKGVSGKNSIFIKAAFNLLADIKYFVEELQFFIGYL
jgi:hypothetical protein